jgi:acetyl-CoA synthetase
MVDQYQALYTSFRWLVPKATNIAELCCRRWTTTSADKKRVALYYETEDGQREIWTYGQLQEQANRLSNALTRLGVKRGDRVGIVLPQRPETIIAHLAVYQLGAVTVPLSTLFGPEALEYRLNDSGARIVLADGTSVENVLAVRRKCPQLLHVMALEVESTEVLPWRGLLARQNTEYTPAGTEAGDAAILIYTSGTTGTPKGALLPHAALIGNLPGFVASQNWFPKPDDVFWSPADWAWTGGLMDALLPTLYFGMPLVGYKGRFSPEKALELMQRYRVTNAFLFPTALKLMMKAFPEPRQQFDLKLRAVMSAGEAMGETVFEWSRQALGVTVNEMFGQTEMNYVVGNSHEKWPARPGSMGRAYPGHWVAVIDDEGNVVKTGEIGEVAVNRYDMQGHLDPVFFLGYWGKEEATQQKFTGNWCRTGDLALQDADGYLWYQGRADDMFKSAGYRIGPAEIENCLLKHPAVADAAVVPKPDKERGALVKAYVVLTPEHAGADRDQLTHELQAHVGERLAAYEYPREIEYIDHLPMTTSGKVQRRILRLREEERAKRMG